MSGEELYELWVAANLTNNCGCEAWDDLEDLDRDCWNTLADTLPS